MQNKKSATIVAINAYVLPNGRWYAETALGYIDNMVFYSDVIKVGGRVEFMGSVSMEVNAVRTIGNTMICTIPTESEAIKYVVGDIKREEGRDG